jgi:WD40 repeat protein
MIATLAAALVLSPAQITIRQVRTMPTLTAIAVAASPAASTIAVALENNTVRIMNAANGQTVRTLTGHPQPVYGLAFSPDGRTLATGDETARIWLWDVRTGTRIRELPRGADLHTRGIVSLSFSPDGRLLASTGRDDAVVVWNVAAARRVTRLLGHGANLASATFHPRGGSLLCATVGQGVWVWSTRTWAAPARMRAHVEHGVADVAINLAGTRILTAGRDGTASVWDAATRTRLATLRGHQDWVLRAAFAPSGRVAATSSSDGTVMVWDMRTYQRIARIENQSRVGAPVTFTRDGRHLVTTTDADGLQIHAVLPAQPAAR